MQWSCGMFPIPGLSTLPPDLKISIHDLCISSLISFCYFSNSGKKSSQNLRPPHFVVKFQPVHPITRIQHLDFLRSHILPIEAQLPSFSTVLFEHHVDFSLQCVPPSPKRLYSPPLFLLKARDSPFFVFTYTLIHAPTKGKSASNNLSQEPLCKQPFIARIF